MRDHFFGQAAVEIRDQFHAAPEQYFLYDPADEHTLVQVAMQDIRPRRPREEEDFPDEHEVENDLLPIRTGFKFLVPEKESQDTPYLDFFRERLGQVLADMVRCDGHRKSAPLERKRLLQDADMRPPI